MRTVGEAGGFEVGITKYDEVTVDPRPDVIRGMSTARARAIAALLVTAAEEAERGKPQLVKPGGKRLPPGPLPEVNPLCGYTTIGPANVRYGQGGWCSIRDYGPFGSIAVVNGLEIPPGTDRVQWLDDHARALDADGKIIASNVPGDEVATPTPPHP